MRGNDILRSAGTILLIDWPKRAVPEALARAGLTVVSHDGPAPDEYNAYEIEGDSVVDRRVGESPERADVVYTHRPIDELPAIAELAKGLGAQAVWCETGSAQAREIVEAAGLTYVDEPIIEAATSSATAR